MINLILLMSCLLLSSMHASVDFDTSMQTLLYPTIMQYEQSRTFLHCFRWLYERHSPDAVALGKSSHCKIPRIIHQIWLGGALPEEYVVLRQSWIDNHPNWVFIFWTDNPINYHFGDRIIRNFSELSEVLRHGSLHQFLVVDTKELLFDNRCFYDKARNYGEKSDILKWEIVYRFGGVYVDTDFECLKPLDELHYLYDFYTGIQPLDTNMVQLGAALFAAHPEHVIFKQCVETIKDNQHIMQIVMKTGPVHFTHCFLLTAFTLNEVNVALPASYFYPCGYNQKGQPAEVWQKPESYAVHHWAGSWLKPEAFEKR